MAEARLRSKGIEHAAEMEAAAARSAHDRIAMNEQRDQLVTIRRNLEADNRALAQRASSIKRQLDETVKANKANADELAQWRAGELRRARTGGWKADRRPSIEAQSIRASRRPSMDAL